MRREKIHLLKKAYAFRAENKRKMEENSRNVRCGPSSDPESDSEAIEIQSLHQVTDAFGDGTPRMMKLVDGVYTSASKKLR